MRHVRIRGLQFSCYKCAYKFKAVCYFHEHLQLHDKPQRYQTYFPIGHYLYNTILENFIFGICIQSSPDKTVCLAISSQILTVDNPIDPPIPLNSFVLLANIQPLPLCAVYRVILNSVITRLGYIMQHFDCWCALRPRENGRHFADAMLKFMSLSKQIWFF